MQFFKSIAIAASALATFAAAQSTSVAIYNMPDTVQVGKSTSLQLKPGAGPFTLTLRRGNPMDLQNVSTITTTASGSSYNWTPASDLENGSDYAIMISQGDQSNFTPLFTITGGKSASSGSSGSSPGSYGGASSSAAPKSTAAPTTMSSAAKTGAPVTQIGDGQVQAPAPSNGTAPTGAPYTPLPGATGSPAPPSNATSAAPTYNAPSTPTQASNGGASAPKGSAAPSAPASGAASYGSSFALIAGAAAAFAFLN